MKTPILISLIITLSSGISLAQMREPEEWLNYETVLNVQNNQRSYSFDVTCIKTSCEANIFYPGDKAMFTFQIVNNTNETISAIGKFDVIRYGANGIPNDIWLPEMIKLENLSPVSYNINIPPKGFQDIQIELPIPETFGGYAIILDLGKFGRRFATGVVRTFKPNPIATQYPRQALDDLGPDFLGRIGVKAIRMGVSYIPTSHRDYVKEMENLNRKLAEYKEKNITVLLMFMEGPALIPLGTPRSFLDDNNTFLKTKQDYVWLPQLDADFTQFVKNICIENGWPKGCVTGVHLWNEPWEGISISGWQSDMLRYREIYKAMAEGVLDARKQGADVLIGGCDSHSNAFDKLFCDGSNEFLPIFDFISIHYEGMESPCLYPEWNNRKDHKGRVLIWDTESWVGNTDDRIAAVVATNRSAGYDRSMGIYGGYMITGRHNRDERKQVIRASTGTREINPIPSVYSPASAFGAVQYLIGERDFNQLLFKNGLPWVMQFDGYNGNPDDGTFVVCGDIGEAFGTANVLFREVRGLTEINEKLDINTKLKNTPLSSEQNKNLNEQLNSYKPLNDGKMIIKAHPSFRLYDFYGNSIEVNGKTLEIPLSFRGYFLRTDGSKGSFMKLSNALKTGYIEGYEPVEIIAADMTSRIEQKPVMELKITNILNRDVKGIFQITLGNLKLSYTSKISLKANETKIVPVTIAGGVSAADNSYPLEVLFDAGKDGKAVHWEDMHVNLISKMSVEINGNLDDWKNTVPQTVTAGKASVSVTEAAWYPFKNFDQKSEGLANAYLAYDDQYFYFASKVADNTPHKGTYRFENLNEDEFFYPDTAFLTDENNSFRKIDGKRFASENDLSCLQKPEGDGRIMNYWEPDNNNIGMGIDLNLPVEKTTRVSFFLPDIESGKTKIEIRDLKTSTLLASQSIEELWNGTYMICDISGNVRVTFKGEWWYNVKLAAVFFDASDAPTNQVATAEFIDQDFDTKGNWKNKYGSIGYWVFGTAPVLPAGITASATNVSKLIPLIWPDGVRHFTYRKDPVLPDNSSGLGSSSDNMQIAFNVIPIGEDGYGSTTKGTMLRYIGYKCTDYEYALNQVAPEYGGGTEIWRLLVPEMPRKHFFPRQPKSSFDGPVKDGKLAIVHNGNTRITECAIPWSEIPDVKKSLDEGKTIKFSFRVNDDGSAGSCMELARDRSVSKKNSRAFHADWKEHWANELEFAFEK